MREKYESLSVAVLRDLAKTRGISGTSAMKKSQLVDAMLAQDEIDAAAKEATVTAETKSREDKREMARGENGTERNTEHRGDGRTVRRQPERREAKTEETVAAAPQPEEPKACGGILEVMSDGFGFIRSDNYLPGDSDVYVSPSQIRKFNLKTGDIIVGKTRRNNPTDKFGALMHIETINDYQPEEAARRKNFEDLTPIFPDERIRLEQPGSSVAMRIVDLVSPIGKGQRGMIVSQPKAGKTTLLKEIAKSVTTCYPDRHVIILLIDGRP